MESGSIGNIGERHVTALLTGGGYTCYRNTQQPGSTDITAKSSWANLLVQVKTSAVPNAPPQMTENERRNIKDRAKGIGFQAWCARVQINARGELVGKIEWEQLN